MVPGIAYYWKKNEKPYESCLKKTKKLSVIHNLSIIDTLIEQ